MKLELLDADLLRRRHGEKWRTYPADVLPAWVADMDFALAEPLRRYLFEVAQSSDTGYPVNPRSDHLPAVFSERMRRLYGWQVSPERVEVLTDVVQGMNLALLAYAAEGDGAVTPVPIYPPFLGAIRETGRRPVHLPLVPGPRGYEFDLDALRAQIDARTRVLMLSHPHNPTGRMFTRTELEQLATLALENGWVVVSDEIHSDLVLESERHVPFASLDREIEKRTVTLTSATKAFNIAGLRCAVAAFGSDDLKRRFAASLPPHVRGGLGSLGLEATRIAWQECEPWLSELRSYLRGNRDHVAAFVRERWPEVAHTPPEATYLAWLDCRGLELPGNAHLFFLREARVALSAGEWFGPGGEGFVRLNFATSREVLQEILERMDAAIRVRAAQPAG